MIGLIIAFVALTLIAAVFHAISYRNNDDMNPKAMLLSLAAAILAAIGFFSMGGGSADGAFIHYINGVRMGSGLMSVVTNLVAAAVAFCVSHFASVGVGYLFGHEREARAKGKPRVWLLVLSIIAIPFGSGFFKSLSMTPDLSAADSLLSIGLGIVIWGLAIWGIVDYIIKKKKQRAR